MGAYEASENSHEKGREEEESKKQREKREMIH